VSEQNPVVTHRLSNQQPIEWITVHGRQSARQRRMFGRAMNQGNFSSGGKADGLRSRDRRSARTQPGKAGVVPRISTA
jgi:hypothetical protein